MAARRVAITGLGLITPLGLGAGLFWDGLMEGRTGVRRVEQLDLEDMPATHYGQLPDIDYDPYVDPRESALWSAATRLAVAGGVLAMRNAGDPELAPARTGVILGTGYGCTREFEPLYDIFFKRGWKRTKPVSIPKIMPSAPASHLGIRLGARGITFTVSTACSSGAIAAGLAVQQIRSGALDGCVTGGLDIVINKSIASAWNSLRVLSRRDDPTASRPFSADRDGLVLAEGCAILVLEEFEAARARGARIYAELEGIGTTNDAVNIVGPDVQGEVEAIRMALGDAGIGPERIDHINAHGTSTEINDSNETKVIKEVFGKRAYEIPVTSIKGHTGHCMGAAGAIELAATALSLHHQRVPATLHYVPGDPECDLDYVADGPRECPMEYAMTNSFGFGGQNSVLVLKRV